ncbi:MULTISPECIES: response regulator [Christiangramia]|uniref:Two-component response regulator n=1 Tax=Christiangramia flava JLT2011 TaxID=1229726 RepID=A0A1L7I9M4_9FLAO|nr:response regulator [Christiangramia flava]APU70308.1 Two-component response regulator [Christiangramia flava JLT2011]OSS37552.1 response regulator [Christiangramia flava JLT2011]
MKIDIACIIDDDPVFVFGTKKIMELANFSSSIMVFHNGHEALQNLKPIIEKGENIPEVILLDLNMPIMDGWEFLDEFIDIPTSKQITIYIVTSSVDPADSKRAEKYDNVSNYLVKPIRSEDLKSILENFKNETNIPNS